MRANELVSEMGWGAEGQKAGTEQNARNWDHVMAKHTNSSPEVKTILKMLRQGNWKAEYAEKEAMGKGTKSVDFWLAHAKKQGYTESLENKLAEALDQDEYTNEADMVQSNLHTIIRMAEELSKILEVNEDMAEWAQEKIAVVKSMIVTVGDYIISQHEQGNVQHTDEEVELDEKTAAALCRSGKRLGRSDYSSCVSQGLRAHTSKGKGHTDGHGNYLKGKKSKSTRYGGDVKDYSGK